MLRTEMNNLLESTEVNETECDKLHNLYILLDLEKDDFCKIVDLIGVEKLLEKSERYYTLCRAEREFKNKEKYLIAKSRLVDMEKEKTELEKTISDFENSLR